MRKNKDEFTFISFDCAYRTLGWCILGFNPSAFIKCARTRTGASARASASHCEDLQKCARDLFHLVGCGVEDVLGSNIDEVSDPERARKLAGTIDRIVAGENVENAVVIIERQPRKKGRTGFKSSVRDTNQTVEAQLIYYFSVVRRAAKVYPISAGKKNIIAGRILHEDPAKTYSTRKKQTRRAYEVLCSRYDFSAHRGKTIFRHIKADLADACLQILAAIFLCSLNIST